MLAFIIAAALAAVPVQAKDAGPADSVVAQGEAAVRSANDLIRAHKPQAALDALAPALAAFETLQAGEKRQLYCGMTGAETLLYMTMAASEKHDAIALSPTYCTMLYQKGFALVDLGRLADARSIYERLVAMAPMNARFLTELAQSYRPEKKWTQMLDLCRRAESAAAISPEELRNRDKGAAWRCQGYALTEQGQLDSAEALYRQCVTLDPNDAIAKHELGYLAGLRGKPKS